MIQVRIAGRQHKIFYGWVVVVVGFVNTTLVTGLSGFGFGTFVVPIQETFGWSKAAIAGARSLMQVEQGLLGPIGGVLIDKFGPRLTMAVGMFLFGAGMIFLSQVQELWQFYLAFVIIAIGSSVGGHLTITTVVNNWFRRKRTWAMAWAQSGLGIGGVTLVPLLVFFEREFGWRWAAVAAGLIIWAFGVSLAMLLRRSPERYGALPDGDEPGQTAEAPATNVYPTSLEGRVDFTVREALRTRAFWLLALGSSLFGMVVTTVMVHQFAHMEEGMGLDRASQASIVIVILGAMNSFGRVLGGWLGDRWSKRILTAYGMAIASASLLILAFATTMWQAVVYGVLFGLFWGIAGAPANSLRGEYFGRASFGKILGMSAFVVMPGLIGGPILAGWMADELGDYRLAFTIFGILTAGTSMLVLFATPPRVPPRLIGGRLPQLEPRSGTRLG